ncbi:MAG: hypothetical protein CMJ18_00050 [Phycisphaeraceae bacterium]|nr:hypothetical protein [Phycisphaeraceae bacterium]
MTDGQQREKLKILGIYAHPHDFLHSSGTCGNHVDAGDSVTVVVLTDGGSTHNEDLIDALRKAPGESDDEVLQQSLKDYTDQKERELNAAAGQYGITDVRILGYRDRPLIRTDEVVDEVVDLICKVRPDILITECPAHIAGSRAVPMPNDHYTVAAIVGEAMTIAINARAGSDRVPHRVAQVYYMATDLAYGDIDFYIDISNQYDKRLAAEMCFESQAQTPDYARKRVETLPGWLGFLVGVAYAEGFVRGGLKVDTLLSVSPVELGLSRESGGERIARQELPQEPSNA